MSRQGRIGLWLALFGGVAGATSVAEEAVQLPAVRVSAVLASLELRLFYLPNAGTETPPLSFLRIESVRQNSAAARAGVEEGMEIMAVQGVRIRGLTDYELNKAMDRPAKNELVLVVRGPPNRAVEKEIRIPLRKPPAAPATPNPSR